MEFVAATDTKTLSSGVVNRENLSAEGFGKFLNHFERNVLTAFFDAMDGRLR